MSAHGAGLARRAMAEHRRAVVVLTVALVLNVVVYVAVVFPLSQRVANVEQRTAVAERALEDARAEFAKANGTLTGKDRAATELATFYKDVLPPSLSGARGMTQLRLHQLAQQSGLKFERDRYEPMVERGSTLTRLTISMSLTGSYGSIRTFIHQLEIAREFVVIDNVELAEGAEGGLLSVTLEMSTYYREAA
jgi:Tfp pilus assembly protein PilO